MPGVMISESAHKRIMDRRDSKLKGAAAVIDYALDCMDKIEEENKEK